LIQSDEKEHADLSGLSGRGQSAADHALF